MNKPNFLILGAIKAGTTSLYYYLGQHPDVFMSEPKETRFFVRDEYERGLEFYWDKYFKEWTGQKAIGEATPSYLLAPFVPARIKQHLPEAKLIATLRNPIDRAFSQWWMHMCNGKEKRSFEEAINENLQRVKAGITFEGEEGQKRWQEHVRLLDQGEVKYMPYIEGGYYAQQIRRYLDLFPSSQLKIAFFEDICRNPHSVVREVFSFIGVDPNGAVVDTSAKYVALDTTENVAKSFGALRWLAVRMGIRELISEDTREKLRGKLSSLLALFGKKPAMCKELRGILVEHYYAHNRELEKLTGRDLSSWDR